MKPKFTFLFLFFLSFSAKAEKYVDFAVEYDTIENLNYGTEISFRFYGIEKKDKKDKTAKKEALDLKEAQNIKYTSVNCDFEFTKRETGDLGGKLILARRPKSLNDSACTISFSFETKDYVLQKKLSIT